jgi:hypothetical protein
MNTPTTMRLSPREQRRLTSLAFYLEDEGHVDEAAALCGIIDTLVGDYCGDICEEAYDAGHASVTGDGYPEGALLDALRNYGIEPLHDRALALVDPLRAVLA